LEWVEIELLTIPFTFLKKQISKKKPKSVGKPQNMYFPTVGNEQIIQLEDFTKVNLPKINRLINMQNLPTRWH
jgi:hypothetical protein